MKRNTNFHLIILLLLAVILLANSDPAATSEPIKFILAWDANTEEDLDGYEIYFRNSNSKYELLGDVYVDELSDSDDPMVTISDIYNGSLPDITMPVVKVPALAMVDGATYYIAMTAFDKHGNSSNFSEELCIEVIGSTVVECNSLNNDDSGGGGGCFISTAI
jgi:hypothetical protein